MALSAHAAMQSTNYQIPSDAIDVAGGLSTSTSYGIEAAVGEQASGLGTSTNYKISAGFEQSDETYISISSPSDVSMPSINGLTGGVSNGSMSWTVTTNASAGYSLSVKASTDPALKGSGGAAFSDYVTAGADPDFAWSITASMSAFGFSPEGSDILADFKDDGATCSTGSLDTADSCWQPFATSDTPIAGSASSNHPVGGSTEVKLRAEIGTSKIQDSGSYSATITATAVSL